MLDQDILALVTLTITGLVVITGFVILGSRYGYVLSSRWDQANRLLHLVLGLSLLVFVYMLYGRLVLPLLVGLTGMLILAGRYGRGLPARWRIYNRWLHLAMGLVLALLVVLRHGSLFPEAIF